MFPKNLHFTGTPLRLQRAVDILPEPKGRVRQRRSSSSSLREKLLQLEPAKLKQWKMKPAMLRLIPDLAVEVNHAPLRERILAITQGSLANMEYLTLQRLIPFVWQDTDTRLALNAHFVRNPPTDSGWLTTHYKAFRTEDPALQIAQSIPDDVPMYALHKHLGMQTSSPLFVEICHRYSMAWPIESTRSWSWSVLLGWLTSGYPREIRLQVFRWLLDAYTHDDLDPVVLHEASPMHDLLQAGLSISTRRDWLLMAPHQQQWLQHVQNGNLLRRWASRQIANVWVDWLMEIQTVDIHRPSGWLLIQLSNHVVVHSMVHTGQELYILRQSTFRQQIVPLLRQSTPFALPDTRYTMSMGDTWMTELTDWMHNEGYGSMIEKDES